MELIDTHCHLDFEAFDADRAQVLARSRAAGLVAIVVPGVTAPAWGRVGTLCRSASGLFPAFGLHPMFMDRHRAGDAGRLERLLDRQRVVAVGEIGLDFYQPCADREAQQQLFDQQLRIAAARRLPVLLHVRKAHDTVLSMLRRAGVPGGIVHAFNGSLQQAGHYIDLGFCLGFGGMLTFERSRRLRQLAAGLPLEVLVLETDAPDMTVASRRGQRNSPEYLPEVAAALAEVRETTVRHVADATSANARRVLALPD